MSDAPATSVRLFRDLASLEALIPAWEDLAANAAEPNPFYEHWMLRPALEHLGGGQEVGIAAVWTEGELSTVVPLVRSRFKGLPARALMAWRHPHCLLCTPLVRKGRSAAEAIGALIDWAGMAADGAPLLEFRYLVAGGAFDAALSDAIAARGIASLASGAYTRGVLRRAADAETYLATISGHTRRASGKKERQLHARGRLEYRVLKPDEDPAGWIEGFLALEAAGWKGQAGSALACSGKNRRFAVEVMREAHRRGRLLASGIDFDGKPIGRLVCFGAGEGAIAFKTAYDESFKTYGPGVLTELHAIREFHAGTALQWIDSFTAPGNALIDRLWKDRLVVHDVALAPRLAGELALAALPLLRFARRALRRVSARASPGTARGARVPRPAASAP